MLVKQVRSILAVLLFCSAAALRAANYALLVGVTQYPNQPEETWLEGPVLDCELLEELLTGDRFGFDKDNITVLAGWPAQKKMRPTRANIARAYRDLARRAAKDDQVFILMSGHGSLQPANNDPDDMEPDGFDEIFLPADAGKWDEEKRVVRNAIVDDDVQEWVEAIVAKGAFVWIVFDSCHSGTMTRALSVEDRHLRRLAPETLIPQEALTEARSRAVRTRGAAVPTGGGMLDKHEPAGGLVAMYAAQSIEPTFEMPLPMPDDPRRGIFTYTIANVLSKANGAFTYRELADRVVMLYRSLGVFSPCPMIEGNGADRLVLGRKPDQLRPKLLLYAVDKGKALKVGAGSLHGMRRGTILEVFPPAGMADAETAIGFVEVRKTEALTSVVKPVKYDGKPKPPRERLGSGLRCRVASEGFGLDPMRIVVQKADPKAEGVFLPVNPGDGPVVIEKALDELVSENAGLLTRRTNAGDADWFLRVRRMTAYLVPKTGWSAEIGDSGTGEPPKFIIGNIFKPREFSAKLRSVLTRIARARRLMQIATSDGAARRDSVVNVTVEVVRYPHGDEEDGQVVPVAGAGRILRDGDTVAFRVTNFSRYPVDVTLLFIDSAFGITALFPEPGTIDDNRILPNKTLETPKLEVTTDTIGPEQLVTLATRAYVDRQDFTVLAQESLGTMRATQSLSSPLGQLLQTAMFGQGQTRALKRKTAQEYRAVLTPWHTVP